MSAENKKIARRWFDEVWNKKDPAAIREMLTEDSLHYGLTGPGGPPVRGFAEFERFHADFTAAFPNLHVQIDDLIAEGDKVALRYTVTGTQQGELQGQTATGKKIKLTGGGICTIKDGKFVEVWNEVDFPKMHYDLAEDTPDVE